MPTFVYRLSRQAWIGVLCLLVSILSLQTRLCAFGAQKAPLRTFVDSELWRNGHSTKPSASSNSTVLYKTAVSFVPPCPDFSLMRYVPEKPTEGPSRWEWAGRLQRPPPGRWPDDAFRGFARNLRGMGCAVFPPPWQQFCWLPATLSQDPAVLNLPASLPARIQLKQLRLQRLRPTWKLACRQSSTSSSNLRTG